MSAKEMFEELGFKFHSKDGDTTAYISDKIYNLAHKVVVVFYEGLNSISVHCGYGKSILITVDLLQAINKQVEELGWNNE